MTSIETRPTPRPGDLDPSDWDTFSTIAHTTLDAALSELMAKPHGPVWSPPPEDALSQFAGELPKSGIGTAAVAEELTRLLPYGVGNTHPRFFGWVHGSGAPGNLLAEMVAASMNANCGGRNHIAIQVERQVVAWCRDAFGFPDKASGIILSGTSMATLVALKTARDQALDFVSRTQGVEAARLVGYVSEQAHSCLDRAFDMLGLGTDALRKIPVDAAYRVDLNALKSEIERDRADGFQPFFVSGTAGTVNTGAIDPLTQLADLAADQNLWFHVDGAFGASLIMSDVDRSRLSGIERADSLAFDFHKWMHVNYEAGCVLIRDQDLHRRAFANRPDYLAADGQALAAGEPWPVDFGPELSRSFRALKVWSHLLEHGRQKIGRSVRKNCEQVIYLAERVDADPSLQRLAPVETSICCFRYCAPDLSEQALNEINAQIVVQLQASGIAAPSTTRLDGCLAIRVNITNHRTQVEDIDLLVAAILAQGNALLSALNVATSDPV